MNRKKSVWFNTVFLLFILLTPSILAVDINTETPLVVSNDDYAETITGIGIAMMKDGVVETFTGTGTYTKEYSEKYAIGPYSIKGKSKKQDVRIEIENATITKEKESYNITGKSSIYKKDYYDEGEIALGSNNPRTEITYTMSWNDKELIITNSTQESKSDAAYIMITGTDPKTIKTNTVLILEKDNVGYYEKVYEQEEGKVIIGFGIRDSGLEIHTNSNKNKIYFTTLTLNDDKTINWNNKTTPLERAKTPTLTMTKTKNGLTITNDKKTINYYNNKKDYEMILNDVMSRGKYYICAK